MSRQRLVALGVCFGCVLAGPAHAGDDTTSEGTGWGWLAGFLSRHERAISSGVVATGRWVDDLFASEAEYGGAPDADGGNRLRVGLTMRVDDDGSLHDEPSIEGRLALPRTRRRFSIFFENEQEDLTGDEREVQDRPLEAGDGALAGLEYRKLRPSGWELTTDAGVRVRSPIDPFARARVRRDFAPGAWGLRLGQSLFWFREDGAGARTHMRWTRPLAENRLFRSTTVATYRDQEERFFYGQDLQLVRRLGPLRAFAWELRVRGESEPVNRVTSYAYGVRWRRAIHEDWLFLELRPEVLHEREDDFGAQPRLFLTLDAVFGDRGPVAGD